MIRIVLILGTDPVALNNEDEQSIQIHYYADDVKAYATELTISWTALYTEHPQNGTNGENTPQSTATITPTPVPPQKAPDIVDVDEELRVLGRPWMKRTDLHRQKMLPLWNAEISKCTKEV